MRGGAQPIDALQQEIGYQFRNRDLLVRALTHSSHVHEILPKDGVPPAPNVAFDNEQMEFLGDSILGFLISETLVERFPDFPEGKLSKLKAHLVSASHLLDAAQKLEIGKYLHLGRGEELSGGRGKRTLIVDALEALIAAVYLDSGIAAARDFVSRFVVAQESSDPIGLNERVSAASTDFKTALQELARRKKLALPRYSIVKERGPEHSKTFTVEVRVGRDWVCQAEGVTKKSASQKAARTIFERMSADEKGPSARPPQSL